MEGAGRGYKYSRRRVCIEGVGRQLANFDVEVLRSGAALANVSDHVVVQAHASLMRSGASQVLT
jgi:hypothetical protein